MIARVVFVLPFLPALLPLCQLFFNFFVWRSQPINHSFGVSLLKNRRFKYRLACQARGCTQLLHRHRLHACCGRLKSGPEFPESRRGGGRANPPSPPSLPLCLSLFSHSGVAMPHWCVSLRRSRGNLLSSIPFPVKQRSYGRRSAASLVLFACCCCC